MTLKYYVDQDGKYVGAFTDGNTNIPVGSSVVATPPENAAQIWNGSAWSDPVVKSYKIYDYLEGDYNEFATPYAINFETDPMIRFSPKYTFNYGELTEVIYYAEQTPNPDGLTFTYSIPIVKETYAYTRDSDGFPLFRTQTIAWYYSDGALDETNVKVRNKIYADKSVDTLNELIRRRDNNIKEIIGALIGLIMTTRPGTTKQQIIQDGQLFFSTHNSERNNYIYEGTEELEDAVRDSSMFAWFADDISGFTPYTTIRGFIIHQLSMGARNM